MLYEFTDVELEQELVILKRRMAFTERAVRLAEAVLSTADERNTACRQRLTFIEGELTARYEAAAASVGAEDMLKPAELVLLEEAAQS